MTVKEYLEQAHRLDERISSNKEELEVLRGIMTDIQAKHFSEWVNQPKKTDPGYVRWMGRITELEERIEEENRIFLDLKREMRQVIAGAATDEEYLVLKYRYILRYTWEQIAIKMHASSRTIRRWHSNALRHIELPDIYITI